ncbi:hypothetical protein ACFWXB_16175 [Tsukamurella tyrosinosolvens]|uniref:hypothetical protein n=1 Tax=Tsukamurella tyrosinosolvens TaxID=57704 RepID=UPI0036757F86
MSTEYDFLFEGLDEPETTTAPNTDAAEVQAKQERAAQKAAAAEAQEAALTAEVDRYIALLPKIEAARPLPAQTGAQEPETPRLSGAAWIEDRLRKVIEPLAAGATVKVGVVGETVAATVIPPAGVKGKPLATAMLAAIHGAGNLGQFEVKRAGGAAFTLRRDGVGATTDAWASHSQKAARFHSDPESRAAVWDAAGLSVPSPKKGMKRQPRVHAFGEDQRGGTVELRLPDGLTIQHVQRARAALRQSLRAPDLEVSERGVHPVLHLNTKAIERSLPKTAALVPTAFTRARTEPEMYAAAKDFTLPIGVRIDPETGKEILLTANLDVTPHGAVFGPTGSGKTVFLSTVVRAAAAQGCADTILWDAKEGSDLRELAFDRSIPGIVHYASGDAVNGALLHRAILFMRDEFDRRKTIARKLAYRGIKYRPRPLLVVMDELPAWLRDQKAMKGDAAKAAQLTEARLDYMGSQARELRIFFIVAGQTAYVEGYPGSIRGNTRTLIQLGEPETVNVNALFAGREKEARDLGNTITADDRGVGVVMDPETRDPVLFRSFFNAPGSPEAVRFDAALRDAPRKRRWAYRLPRGDELGADGTWMQWHPLSEPSSDSLVAQYLDDESFHPYEDRRRDDPTDPSYDPGTPPAPARHLI